MNQITVTTAAVWRDLTTLEAVKRELCIEHADHDEWLRVLVAEASEVLEEHTGRVIAREAVTEDLPAYGRTTLRLERTPLVLVSEVRFDAEVIAATDYSIHDAATSQLWRDASWTSTEVIRADLTRYLGPDPPKNLWHVDYVAGWIVPRADLFGVSTIQAIASDDSYNDSASDFPLLVVGDTFLATGFANAGNNGTKTVATRTAAKITVDESLTDEAAGVTVNLGFRNLPRPLERAAVVTVKSWYMGRKRDPSVVTEKIGSFYSAKYEARAIPKEAQELASPWVCSW